MNIIIGILLVLFVVAAVLLILIILAQDDGTEGAGIIFGSAASQQYGARKGNVITRTTGVLAVAFISIAFVLSFLFQRQSTGVDLEITGAGTSVIESDATLLEWWKAGDTTENGEDIPLTDETNFESNPTKSSPVKESPKEELPSIPSGSLDALPSGLDSSTQESIKTQ